MSTAQSSAHTPGPDFATLTRFIVKRNWAGKGFVLVDGATVIATHETKRAAVQERLARIAAARSAA